jgi:large subunit ribosomal protein L13
MQRERITIDATDKSLGRLATEIATLLRGKNRPDFTPNIDNGAFVSIINGAHVKITGKKADQKEYKHYSGYPGGLKSVPLKQKEAKKPGSIIQNAVWGMLPTNRLRNAMFKRLTIKQ